ncbi:MAG: hypothetical protein OZ921_04825 [Sorangiineae bacterium]|nr:hypothetical protein [Sorangiineae bacterium]
MTNQRFFKYGIFALTVASAVAACRADDDSSPGGGTGGAAGGTSTGGAAGGTSTGGAAGGTSTGGAAGGTSTGGAAGGTSTGGAAGGTSTGGAGGSDGGVTCAGQTATVVQVTNGTIGADQNVELTGVVATSQKFLASQSKSTGSCLWAVFVSAPGLATATEYSGVMVYSYGTPSSTTGDGGVGECPTGTDAIPDDVKPGDELHVYAKTSSYLPATADCAGKVAQTQLRTFKSCPVTKTGTAAVPAPHILDTATANALAAGTDATVVRKWAGALVALENVTAPKTAGGKVVGPFGVITFQENDLEAHDKLFYYDLADGGPKGAGKAWAYAASPVTFTKMTGIAYLDYCTWALSPRDKCLDVAPASDGCPP